MTRQPVVSGQFYPSRREQLITQLDEMIPGGKEQFEAAGVLCPHAGYMFSGKVAGEVYASIKPKETYIVIGPNHTGRGLRFSASADSWETPLGTLDVDEGLLSKIMSGTGLVEVDPSAHAGEHSVEVQLPFIQRTSPGAKIVPLAVSHGQISELFDIGRAIAEAALDSSGRVMVVASSDMTHYEPRRSASEKDKVALQKMLDFDPEGLLDAVRRMNISMCGYIPAVIMLIAAKQMGAEKARLIRYADSGEVTGDTEEVVGYAGIAVY